MRTVGTDARRQHPQPGRPVGGHWVQIGGALVYWSWVSLVIAAGGLRRGLPLLPHPHRHRHAASRFDQEAAMAQGISVGRVFAIAWGAAQHSPCLSPSPSMSPIGQGRTARRRAGLPGAARGHPRRPRLGRRCAGRRARRRPRGSLRRGLLAQYTNTSASASSCRPYLVMLLVLLSGPYGLWLARSGASDVCAAESPHQLPVRDRLLPSWTQRVLMALLVTVMVLLPFNLPVINQLPFVRFLGDADWIRLTTNAVIFAVAALGRTCSPAWPARCRSGTPSSWAPALTRRCISAARRPRQWGHGLPIWIWLPGAGITARSSDCSSLLPPSACAACTSPSSPLGWCSSASICPGCCPRSREPEIGRNFPTSSPLVERG